MGSLLRLCAFLFFSVGLGVPVAAQMLADRIAVGSKFKDVLAIASSAGEVHDAGVSIVTNGPILEVLNPHGYSLRDAGLVRVKYVFDREQKMVASYYTFDSKFFDFVLDQVSQDMRLVEGPSFQKDGSRAVLLRHDGAGLSVLLYTQVGTPLMRMVLGYRRWVENGLDGERAVSKTSNKPPTSKASQ